ncbi:anti-sigma factor family protein [Pseudidiomarina sp. E22-M8]|uniref:anti-sigma factor family protein n=1 Tax=Pseudidiomarina sp. E22-M8 TaxID=3424768 RepID=UPI00403CD878
MNITDVQLSAFLDNELSATEMEQVRSAIATDEQLAERLAQLAQVDEIASKRAELLMQTPLPETVLAMLDEPKKSPVKWFFNLLNFSWPTAAIAASLAVVVTLQLSSFGQISSTSRWQTLTAILETQPSGATYSKTDFEVSPRFSFLNKEGQFCRQYRIIEASAAAEAIACRTANGQWQEIAKHTAVAAESTGDYQTATGQHTLDLVLDQIMYSEPLVGTAEQRLLDSDWRASVKEPSQ